MKFITTLSIFISIQIANINAQSTDKSSSIHYSSTIEVPSDCALRYFDAGDNKKLVEYYDSKKFQYFFLIYSADLKLQKSNSILVRNKFGENVNFDRSFFKKVGNKIYLFYYVEKGKLINLNAVEFSLSNLDFIGDSYPIVENVPTDLYFESQAPDNSKILLRYNLPPTGNKGEQKRIIGLIVLDEDLKKIQNQQFEVPYYASLPVIYVLSNSGTVFSYGKVFDTKKGKDQLNNVPNYHFEVYSFEPGKKDYSITSVMLTDYFLNPFSWPQLSLNTDNTCSVFFISQKTYEGNDGIVFIKIDSKQSSYNIKDFYFEIPEQIIKQGKKENEFVSKSGRNIQISTNIKSFSMQDGGCDLVFIEKGGYTVTSEMLYVGIYTLNFDKENKLKWIKKIPFRQINSDYGFLGFNGFVKNNVLNLFYCELENNLNLSTIEAMTKYKHTGEAKDDGILCRRKISEGADIFVDKIANLKDFAFPITVEEISKVGNQLIYDSAVRNVFSDKVLLNKSAVVYAIDME